MGYSVSLLSGIYLKLKPKNNIDIKKICRHHDQQHGEYCNQCGKKLEDDYELPDSLLDLIGEDDEPVHDICYNDENTQIQHVLVRIEFDEPHISINGVHEEDELYELPDLEKFAERFKKSKEFIELLDDFEIIEEKLYFGIFHSY